MWIEGRNVRFEEGTELLREGAGGEVGRNLEQYAYYNKVIRGVVSWYLVFTHVIDVGKLHSTRPQALVRMDRLVRRIHARGGGHFTGISRRFGGDSSPLNWVLFGLHKQAVPCFRVMGP